MPDPLTPLLDNFTRPDGPLGPNWVAIGGTCAIDTNQCAGTDGGVDNSARWHTLTGADCDVYASFPVRQDDGSGNVLFARLLADLSAGYTLTIYRDDVGGDLIQLDAIGAPGILTIPIMLLAGDAFWLNLTGRQARTDCP